MHCMLTKNCIIFLNFELLIIIGYMVFGSLERPLTGHKEGGGVGGCHRGLGAGTWKKNLEEANLI